MIIKIVIGVIIVAALSFFAFRIDNPSKKHEKKHREE